MAFDDYPTRTIQLDDRRIHIRIAGETGPVVLLCHGFPESAYSWRHQLDALSAAGYRAVAMDMRGYGRSSKPADSTAYSIPDLVDDCVQVVEGIGESTAVIVGHDFGAPVAWTAAWTRPDIFRAVAGLSVPFAGRGLAALPGDPFGAVRPSEHHQTLAGPGRTFYQDYLAQPGDIASREIERDLRSWLISGLFTLSANAPQPAELSEVDLLNLPEHAVIDLVRAAMCIPDGARFADQLQFPDALPDWLTEEDVDHMVAELEHTGLRAPLAWYSNADAAWETLEPFADEPLTTPALFIGGDRDIATIWSQQARLQAGDRIKDLRGSVIVSDCGHWIQQERPAEVSRALLNFLSSL